MRSQAAVRIGSSLCKHLLQSKQNIASQPTLCCHGNIFECSKQATFFLTVRNLSTFRLQAWIEETPSTDSLASSSSSIGQKNCVLNDNLMKLVFHQRRHAGHSHWQNIQHIKGAKDKLKSDASNLATRRIRQAIREGGSVDPKINSALAKALEQAKAKSVPNETLQRVLKAAEASALNAKEELIEGKGMGGLMFVIKAYTDKPAKARTDVQSKLKKYGATIGASGTSMHSFKQTGIVEIELGEEDSRNHDDHIEIALEAEAEDVSMETREDGKNVLQFVCDHLTVKQVKNHLESQGKNVIYAESVFIPLQTIALAQDGMENLGTLIEKLKEFDHVEEVFTNAVLQS